MTNKDYNFGIYDSILKLLPSVPSAATRETITVMIGQLREKDETIAALRAQVASLERSRDDWQEQAKTYCQNADFWRAKHKAAEPCVHQDVPEGCYRVRCQLGKKCMDDDLSFRRKQKSEPEHQKPAAWLYRSQI